MGFSSLSTPGAQSCRQEWGRLGPTLSSLILSEGFESVIRSAVSFIVRVLSRSLCHRTPYFPSHPPPLWRAPPFPEWACKVFLDYAFLFPWFWSMPWLRWLCAPCFPLSRLIRFFEAGHLLRPSPLPLRSKSLAVQRSLFSKRNRLYLRPRCIDLGVNPLTFLSNLRAALVGSRPSSLRRGQSLPKNYRDFSRWPQAPR